MSKSIRDIDDQEFIKMVREMESKSSFFDRLYYSLDKTGIQCILPESFQTRTIENVNYFWGFRIENKYEHQYILNVLCDHHHNDYYGFISEEFIKKMNSSPILMLPGIIEFELNEIEDTLINANQYFKLGYKLQKGAEKMHTINDDIPTNEIAWSLACGSSSYVYEVFLKETLKLYAVKDEPKVGIKDTSDEPAFSLQTQFEVVLYFKYSGLYDSLSASGRSKSAIAKIISQLTKLPASSIRPILSAIEGEYSENAGAKKLFKQEYIENVINALLDAGFDTTELSKVYKKILST